MGRYLVRTYFKDARGEWHQPGNLTDMEEEEAREAVKRGDIQTYRTQSMEPPETREGDRRARIEIFKTRHRRNG
jgi:hypothetical protein